MRPLTSRRLITLQNPKSPISESYVKLRTNIELSAVDGPLQTIMITSANSGEGKSTTASNLAVVYAQADKKVLLIDCDLRKPSAHQYFMVSNRSGLTSVLVHQQALEIAIKETFISNLHLLPSGPIPPNPSELLSSKRMAELFQTLRGRYDIIIVDTPPLMAVADAQIVSTICDGVILVLSSGQVKREMALKAKASLVHAKARILGIVLNNFDRKMADSYYYYYYYGYGTKDD